MSCRCISKHPIHEPLRVLHSTYIHTPLVLGTFQHRSSHRPLTLSAYSISIRQDLHRVAVVAPQWILAFRAGTTLSSSFPLGAASSGYGDYDGALGYGICDPLTEDVKLLWFAVFAEYHVTRRLSMVRKQSRKKRKVIKKEQKRKSYSVLGTGSVR
jgi:hypothetical protein